jgi:hypothetical protein
MALPLAVPLVMAGAGLVTKGYGAYEANKRQKQADKQLAELAKKPYDQFKVNPLVQRYTQMGLRDIQNPQGFTGAEAAQFQQRIAAGQEAARRNAISLGGSSVARAVGGALNSANLAAENQFAAQGAGLARSNRNLGYGRFMQGAGVAQGVDQMNTQQALQRRMQLEQGLGIASRQAADQQRAMIQGMGSDLLGAGTGLAANELAYSKDPFGMAANAPGAAQKEYGLSNRKVANIMGAAEGVQTQRNAKAKGFSGIPNISPDRGTRSSAAARRALRNMPPIAYDESYFDVSGLGQ